MLIDEKLCTGCGECLHYCSVGAIIATPSGRIGVAQDECVECGACLRSGACVVNALAREQLSWPRVLRARFSDPEVRGDDRGPSGRVSPGMKTDDVTHQMKRDEILVSLDMGRPNLGVRLRSVEKVTRAVAAFRPVFKIGNPVTALMVDVSTGRLRDDVLDEKVLTATIEFTLKPDALGKLADLLRPLSQELDTVFSLGLACLANEDGSSPLPAWAAAAGIGLNPNGKLNVGLGRGKGEA